MLPCTCATICGRPLCTTGLPSVKTLCRGLDIERLGAQLHRVACLCHPYCNAMVLLGAMLRHCFTLYVNGSMSITLACFHCA